MARVVLGFFERGVDTIDEDNHASGEGLKFAFRAEVITAGFVLFRAFEVVEKFDASGFGPICVVFVEIAASFAGAVSFTEAVVFYFAE